jgi:redox-sensing transcriptional repressor
MTVGEERNSVSDSLPTVSRAAAGRLSLYLRQLNLWLRDGVTRISSQQLGDALDIHDAQVRKDLAALGSLGQRGIGYNTGELIAAIRHTLGIDRSWKTVVVGIGNLAKALLKYQGFRDQGFQIVALFDIAADKVGSAIEGITIHSLDELPEVVVNLQADLGLITVPSESAQLVADRLIEAGIRGILNFAPTMLRVPSQISLVSVDVAVQLEQLAFLVQIKGTPEDGTT